ncbi:MAG: VWA domain-containing protein [Elusimicrobia bacterium]|nr:VWA domain-containing protein [Elusimicrobiota bacterium]
MTKPHAVSLLEEGGERRRALGALSVVREGRRGRLPLASVSIAARAARRVAEVTVTQAFVNPLGEALEAVYTFPLSGGCAVSRCELRVAGKLIVAELKERGEARAEYQEALAEGKRAALLEQERGDVFTLQVGNLPPGERAEVTLTYSEALPYLEDGTAELRLPLVVAPRYVPGTPLSREPAGTGVEWDTDQVPDASRLSPPRLAPGFDPKVGLSIEVELEGDAVEDLACSQHAIRLSGGKVALANKDELLDRDFVLRWRLSSGAVKPSLEKAKGGFAMLTLVAPPKTGFTGLPRDVVFLLDRSGSMEGPKMASAARACSILLGTLAPRDRFAICAFDNDVEWFGRELLAADDGNVARGDEFLRGIDARGGTELGGGLSEALRRLGEAKARAGVVVVITDGQVGHEGSILAAVQKELADARIFTVGIDTAVNEAFLSRLSAMGGGTATCCRPGAALEEALSAVAREIGEPLITGLRVEGAQEAAPERLPDLFAGRAATVFLKAKGAVTVTGRWADGKAFSATVKPESVALGAIEHLWARARIRDLEDRFRAGEDVRARIVELSVKHSVLSRFTAYVAVDERKTELDPSARRTLTQPVHMPAQWAAGAGASFAACAPAASAERAPQALDRMAKRGVAPKGGPPAGEPRVDLDVVLDEAPLRRRMVGRLRDLLEKTLREVAREAAGGSRSDASELETLRNELLKHIAMWGLETELSALQRFLRGALRELVAALRAKETTPAQAAALAEKCLEALAASKSGADRPFWEAAI